MHFATISILSSIESCRSIIIIITYTPCHWSIFAGHVCTYILSISYYRMGKIFVYVSFGWNVCSQTWITAEICSWFWMVSLVFIVNDSTFGSIASLLAERNSWQTSWDFEPVRLYQMFHWYGRKNSKDIWKTFRLCLDDFRTTYNFFSIDTLLKAWISDTGGYHQRFHWVVGISTLFSVLLFCSGVRMNTSFRPVSHCSFSCLFLLAKQ